MSRQVRPGAEPAEEPSSRDPLAARVIALGEALESAGIPFAFGDAVALACYTGSAPAGEIDLLIFVPASAPEGALEALGRLHPPFAAAAVAGDTRDSGQARVRWDAVRVNLFFQDLPFLESAARRTKRVPFAGTHIEVLSAEDLVVCKAMFNRRKDWDEIEQLLYHRGYGFNYAYARSWLFEMVGTNDLRVRELDLLATQVEHWMRSRRR